MSQQRHIKLNLGCGRDQLSGWINVDAVSSVKPDRLLDLREPWPWAANSVDEILAKDILEHFIWEDLQEIVQKMALVTRTGGKVTVRVPHIEQINKRFARSPEVRNLFLYGATHGTGVFGAHKIGFTKELLIALFERYGFRLQLLEEVTINLLATFVKKAPLREKKYFKAVWFVQSFSWGGAEVFLSELLSHFNDQASQNESTIIYTNNQELRTAIYGEGVHVRRLQAYGDILGDWKGLVKTIVRIPHTLWWYAKTVWQHRDADALICVTNIDKLLVTPLASILGVPVIWNEFGPVKPLVKKWLRIPELLYRLVHPLANMVIVPSVHTKQQLMDSVKISLEKLELIPCGRDLEQLTTKRGAEMAQRVVCVSRLEKGKGQELLIQAFKEVVREIPQARLHIVGTGDYGKYLQRLITKLGLQNQIKLTGFVENVLDEVQAASVCVFPSVWELEGFGLVAIEAMALSKPIVAFNRAPINEIVEHDTTGLLVEVGSETQLARAIIRLLEDEKRRTKLGKKGREVFKERYQIERVVANYRNALAWVRARQRARTTLTQKYHNLTSLPK